MSVRVSGLALRNDANFRVLAEEQAWIYLGNRVEACAVIDTHLRSLLRTGDRLIRADDHLTVHARHAVSGRDVERLALWTIDAAALLDRPAEQRSSSLLGRLDEPDVDVRMDALRALTDERVDDSLRAEALARGRRDTMAAVRLAAAEAGNDQAAIDAVATDPSASTSVATRALRRASPAARVRIAADRARPLSLRKVALSFAEAGGAAMRTLTDRIAQDGAEPTELRAAALSALAEFPGSETETTLLAVLSAPRAGVSRASPDAVVLRDQAIRTLGRVGTARALATLRRFGQSAGLYAPLWEPAQAAIAAIIAREPDVEAGSLSALGPSGGDLALVRDPSQV